MEQSLSQAQKMNEPIISEEMFRRFIENFRFASEIHERFVRAGLADGTFAEALARRICGIEDDAA